MDLPNPHRPAREKEISGGVTALLAVRRTAAKLVPGRKILFHRVLTVFK
jgi:hypothetical protein